MLTDLGGTPVALEIFDTIVAPGELVDELVKRIRRLLATHDGTGRCEGIGLVVPGMVDQETGRVLHAPQLGWRNVDIRDLLAARTGVPVYIENAPIACALAHMWLGKRDSAVPTDFVYVTVSDGVGAGIVMNGQVVRGHAHTAGEFGHVPIELDGPLCLCGARGCLEAYTSNLATLSRYLGHEFSPTESRALLHSSGLTTMDVIARAQAGDARAAFALDETARYLGTGLSIIINSLNPAQVFIGGEIAEAWDRVSPTIRKVIASRALTEEAASIPIIPELASSHPRLRGAVALVAAPVFAAPQVG
jgi:N-acetylglucosamine repressor